MIIPEKWKKIDPQDVNSIIQELKREVCPLHPLYNKSVRPIIRRLPFDDVLFEVSNDKYPFYIVHLTWAIESNPMWPYISKFVNYDDFINNWERVLFDDLDDDENWRFYNN